MGASASEWPHETISPARTSRSTRSSPPGSSGASVTVRTGPAAIRRSASGGSGARRWIGSCAPAHSGDRNGPSRWTPVTIGRPAVRGRDLGRRGERLGVGVDAGGHEGRLEGHHTRARKRLGRAPVADDVGGQEVDPGDAVDVGVDESGHRGPAGPAGRTPTAATTPSRSSHHPRRAARQRARPRLRVAPDLLTGLYQRRVYYAARPRARRWAADCDGPPAPFVLALNKTNVRTLTRSFR